jgi:hypothetical protein
MIVKYDIKKYLKDNKIKKIELAKKIGISKQLLNYHLNKGDLPFSYLVLLGEISPQKFGGMIIELEKKYVKVKI